MSKSEGAEDQAPSAGQTSGNRADRMRIRAAWMYFVEQMTQNDIADILGVGRVTVVRMLAEARIRNEVKIAIEGELAEIVGLERSLEIAFGIEQVVVAPLSDPEADPIPTISAATGAFLSNAMKPGMTVGVGWGRTLFACLSSINARNLQDFKVISLLGGVSQARRFNPAEFAWRFAQVFQGDGYLIPAPAMVDSLETKEALIKRCGLQDILDMADNMDAVVVSVGGIDSATTFYRGGFLTEKQRSELEKLGAVGDLLFHFYDRNGDVLNHPINNLIMSVEVDRIRRTPLRILASGGIDKRESMLGAMRLVQPTVLITDEESARRLLQGADDFLAAEAP
ncbi:MULTISPECIES: sugar-binding transcriptional regulator [Rhizobium]|uniref:Sugar-binding transcriptional regulator n=1 Tax=Rhizobium rhododendri TaxID=2506430 RepID=A0ABY8ISP6_9HYPH|nr:MULTISPECIES: sugar-binding transcriptional regulator [Rhizobium]MBZ5759349.1 sugar-binding transcriptional regulator [Rhizobium sp. VS19-DR96]MBZ5765918.1 sugar-binding transcriptional regulator [Rhizobium sp. VS19-DR129.2]MBZ5774002.1 sugar-binding transcriptional regulator [Rhizobium sp. VS19-DRK62.2]MBZ5785074.1 sugar-binding transcriptional regulator [Rhizobium sp. VS19-DR121]MBZ5801849.1 sugar-binding transcriptional regulator [Rhizobium sp. VS19-DR181]